MIVGNPSPCKGEDLSTIFCCTVLRKCPGIHCFRDRPHGACYFLAPACEMRDRVSSREVYSTAQAHKTSQRSLSLAQQRQQGGDGSETGGGRGDGAAH